MIQDHGDTQLTFEVLTLTQIVVVVLSQQSTPITPNDAFQEPVGHLPSVSSLALTKTPNTAKQSDKS